MVLAALLVAWKLGYFDLERRRHLADVVHALRARPGTAIVFVVAYAIALSVGLPATIATVVAGAMFGFWSGSALAWIGALIATVVAHSLARSIAREPLRKLFGEHRLLRRLRERGGIMALLRL